MGMMEASEPTPYAVNLDLAGRPCLVVGGGTVAAHKIRGLLAAGADVTVVAPVVHPSVTGQPVTVFRRRYRSGDVEGYRLVVTCTGDPEANRQVFVDAEAIGVLVNAADDPANCTLTLPAVARRGDLTVAISTGGRSPAVASWLRRRLERELDERYEILLDVAAAARAEARAEHGTSELPGWAAALDPAAEDVLDLARPGAELELLDHFRRHLGLTGDRRTLERAAS